MKLMTFLLLLLLPLPLLSFKFPDNFNIPKIVSGGLPKFFKSVGEAFGALFDCSYTCPNGGYPIPRPRYKPTPNGCGTDATLFTKDLARVVPQLHECCSAHDSCYGTCGSPRGKCDKEFRKCLKELCGVAKQMIKAVGRKFDVEEMCQSAANGLFAVVAGAGCEAYRTAQKEACICVARSPEL